MLIMEEQLQARGQSRLSIYRMLDYTIRTIYIVNTLEYSGVLVAEYAKPILFKDKLAHFTCCV